MRIKLALLAIAGIFVMQAAVAEEGLVVSDAWVREGPPSATALGGFMVIHNHSDKRTLVKASSSGFGMAELHRSMQHDGMMKMVRQEKIVIPAKGSVTFKPGDYHIMLMKPKKAYKAGDHVTVTLGFADGSAVKVKYAVRKGNGMDMGHGGHDMNHMKH
jgi:copper(I)-binding protein